MKSTAQRSVLARVSAGALLCGSVIAAVAAIAASFGIIWPGGKDSSRSPHINSLPDGSALTLPDAERASAKKADRDKKKKEPEREQRRAVLVASDVRVLAPQGLVVRGAPAGPAKPAVTVDETASVAPKPHRPPAPKRPVASVVTTPLPAAAAAQPVADRSTGLVRLSVRSVAVAPNAASKPELLVKMGIDGANPADAVPDTVTLHVLPQVPASVPKDDPTLALTARVDMVEAPRSAPTDPALRMRVQMRIAPVDAGTPMVQEPGPGDGKSNVIALTVSLDSFSDTPEGGTPDQPSDPEPPAPVEPDPGQPESGGPTPAPPGPVEPEPGQPDSDAPTAPVTPQPAPIPHVEVLLPVGPVRPNTETTTVPIIPGTDDGAPPAESIPVDIVLEELPPDEPPPGAIPVDVVLEELPPDEPPANPADVPTPGAQEPAADVPGPPSDADSDPESEAGTSPAGVDAAPAVSAPASADATP